MKILRVHITTKGGANWNIPKKNVTIMPHYMKVLFTRNNTMNTEYKLFYLCNGVWVEVAQAPAEKIFVMSRSAIRVGFLTKITRS